MVTTKDFEDAVARVGGLTRDPGSAAKLDLYAFYKQATEGDVSGSRPGMVDFVGRAKYDAWAALAGLSAEEAQERYVARVNQLAG